MNKLVYGIVAALALTMTALNVDAAKRFGGGGNLGKQRAAPTQQKDAAPTQQPTTPPASQAQPAPGAAATGAGAAAAAKPSFMQRWGGLLAGLGIGALLASMFGAELGPIIGMLLLGLLIAAVLFFVLRMFARRNGPQPAPAGGPAEFTRTEPPRGTAVPPIGSRLAGGMTSAATPDTPRDAVPAVPPGFQVEPFVRVAKTSFIRLQAANDRGDLDDIRDFTTPQLFAEIAMQVRERGEAQQKTEVVSLEAKVIEAVVEADYEIASVRFWGLLREEPDASPVPFDETWHVQKRAHDPKAPWLIAGIQQND